MQFSGAIWYPIAYDFPPELKRSSRREKRVNQMARARQYIEWVDAAHVFPCAGPPAFLDDDLFALNDLDRDPANIFPDQTVFLETSACGRYRHRARCSFPARSSSSTSGECTVTHPVPESELMRPFTDKREYLDEYRARLGARGSPTSARLVARAARSRRRARRTWFEPLLRRAPITSAGIAGNVVLDVGEPDANVCIDFVESEVRPWNGDGEPYVYKIDVDRRLVEALLERHIEDWVNSLFLSCRFVGHRPDPANFNEFVMTFFKALSPERIAYVERCYRERRDATDEFFERDGWRIERWCPHRQADLTRFGEIDDGVLTCSLHHWQFDLETGKLPHERRQAAPVRACDRRAAERLDGVSAFNHVGQCVTDLERSKRFYCELLGFTLEREIKPPDECFGAADVARRRRSR